MENLGAKPRVLCERECEAGGDRQPGGAGKDFNNKNHIQRFLTITFLECENKWISIWDVTCKVTQ